MRLIDADALLKRIWEGTIYETNARVVTVGFIQDAPTIEAEPVRHGRWEWFEDWVPSTPVSPRECLDCGWMCGNCRETLEDMVGGYWDDYYEKPQLAYCPNCGAKMDNEGVDD